MKKFIMAFLVAGLMITSALSLSSCKKTDTNSSTNVDSKDWMPTVVTVINPDDLNSNNRDNFVDPIDCPYFPRCDQGPLYFCNHGYVMWPLGEYCHEHYHAHEFTADEDCTPDILNLPGPWACQYLGVRKHVHIVSYTRNLWHIDTHTGGGAWGPE